MWAGEILASGQYTQQANNPAWVEPCAPDVKTLTRSECTPKIETNRCKRR